MCLLLPETPDFRVSSTEHPALSLQHFRPVTQVTAKMHCNDLRYLVRDVARRQNMAYVITDKCIKDEPGFDSVKQLYVDPAGCIDCGACVPVCTSESIHSEDDLTDDLKPFVEINSKY